MRQKLCRRIAALALAVCALCAGTPLATAARAETAPAAAPAFTGEELAYIAAHKTLRVGYVQDRVPISFRDDDGELAGVSRAVFDRVAELCGLTFEYVPLPTGSVTYEYLMDGGFDLVTSVEYNEENLNARGVLISQPYLTSRKVVVAGRDVEFRADAPLTVAISSGSQTIRKVLGASYPNFTIEDYDSIPACFSAVKGGQADLLILNQYVVEYWISKPVYEGMKVIPALGLDDQLCFSAVVDFTGQGAPTEADGRLLIDILNKAIAAIPEDVIGTYTIQAVMDNQYSYTLEDFLYRYRFAVFIFITSVLVISLLTFLLLRQRVRTVAQQADARAKGEFLSTMSHEIRTPLNGLIGLDYLMAQNLDDRPQLEGYLQQSTATAKYLLSLVDDILDMSRLEAGKTELSIRPVDLPLLFTTVEALTGSGMKEKGLAFEVKADIAYPCVLGDEVRIQQVLMNLLDNARKFTPAGGSVTLTVAQAAAEDGSVVTHVAVTDTGRGMSEAFHKHVFDSFAQERDTVSKGNDGTGLGLPISRSLARLMGGDLTFTSRPGQGSRFEFSFPGKPAQPPAAPQTPPADDPPAARPRVLVAEDNELNAEIMLELLAEAGFAAEHAADGRQALRRFADSPVGHFGVVLMDLLMPELDGFQAAAAIRALDRPDAKTVRIIACTANSFAQDREKALASGMDDFVAKPVDMEELLQKISR